MLKEGYRAEDIDKAREFKAAEATLELALNRLGYATISSPVNGVVLVRPMEPGMTAAVGAPVVTLGDMDNIYFEGYIPETDLAKVKFGMKAEVTTDSYPEKVPGLGVIHQCQGGVHPQDGGDLQRAGHPGLS